MPPDRDRAGQFRRLGEVHRQTVHFFVNGRPAQALAGDTILTALLLNGARVRASEFGDGPRAGFCNMGACQDCWISLESGARVRACSEPIRADLRIVVAD